MVFPQPLSPTKLTRCPASIIKFKEFFDKYGGYTLLLSWVPIIGDPITFIAGILKYDLKKFIILVVIAKFLRYVFLAYLTLFYNV